MNVISTDIATLIIQFIMYGMPILVFTFLCFIFALPVAFFIGRNCNRESNTFIPPVVADDDVVL